MSIGGILLSPFWCLLWVVVGAVAGGLAHNIMGGKSQGLVPDVVLGLIGAIVGGFILNFFFNATEHNIFSIGGCFVHVVVATFGACVLVFIGRLISGRRAAM